MAGGFTYFSDFVDSVHLPSPDILAVNACPTGREVSGSTLQSAGNRNQLKMKDESNSAGFP